MSNLTKRVHREDFEQYDHILEQLEQKLEGLRLENGRALRYFVRTFGCQQNENDSEKLRGILNSLGFSPAEDYDDADLVLINTCSIRENADLRLYGHLGTLKALKRKRKQLITGVCGCLPTQEEQARKIRESFSFVNLLFGPADIHKLPYMLLQLFEGQKRVYDVGSEDGICEGLPIARDRKFRGLVSIMYGCNNFCTYCVVPKTRGRERSRLPEDILRECRELAEAGIPEVMLLGQNVNAWGFDLQPDKRKNAAAPLNYSEADLQALREVREGKGEINSFARLLTAIAGIPGIKRIRYMSPHPRDFDGEMIAALKLSPEIENHLHLPLQSGSDAVLKKMNRYYNGQRFRDIIAAVRSVRPDISLTTDIIVGFPAETEEDFEDTLRMVEDMAFESAFTFIYSARPGTPAARMEQLPPEVQHARFDRLAELQNRLSLEAHQKLLGETRQVLIEGISHGDECVLTGRDSEFHLINVHLPGRLLRAASDDEGHVRSDYFEGRFAEVKISEAKTYSMEAEWLAFLEPDEI